MLLPALFLLGLGFGAAVILSIASKIFYVWEDPKVIEVEENLLGANCGGCGYPGCHAAAVSVVAGKALADVCVAGGPDIAKAVAVILGVEIELKEADISTLTCRYSVGEADTKFNYIGVNDCRAAALVGGGPKECPIGCIGLGTCVRACPFGAMEMGKDGLPVIIKEKCRACGICIEICPKNILHLSSTSTRMIGESRIDECTTPCQRTCPTGIDIQAHIKQTKLGNYEEAIRIIKEKNPLPLVCGRICPAPCEKECRRNLVDEPVAINYLKRFVADYEMKSGKRIHPYLSEKTGKKVAIIGGGSQGLTTSYYLACLGHDVSLYEATDELGGVIRKVITKSRLPDEVINWEIDGILDAGVKAETGVVLGKDITIDSLLFERGFNAVALSTGGLESRRILRGDSDSTNIISGVYLLLDYYVKAKNNRELNTGDRVYIFGGGNSALEVANICRQKGAGKISIIYPFSQNNLTDRGIDISKETENGVEFIFSSVINMIKGEHSGLSGLRIKNIESGQIEERAADTLIAASGSLADIILVRDRTENNNEEYNGWHSLETYKLFPDTDEDLFNTSKTFKVNDNLAVVRSIGRGRKIARAVHQFITGRDISPQDNVITDNESVLNLNSVREVGKEPRQLMPVNENALSYSEADRRFKDIEVNAGFSEALAKKEAARCLECGLICYKKAV